MLLCFLYGGTFTRAHTHMYTRSCACVHITSARARSLSLTCPDSITGFPSNSTKTSPDISPALAAGDCMRGKKIKSKGHLFLKTLLGHLLTYADECISKKGMHLSTSASPYTHTNTRTHTHTHTHTHKHTHTWGSTWATRTPRCTSRGKPRTDCRSSANTLRSVSKKK